MVRKVRSATKRIKIHQDPQSYIAFFQGIFWDIDDGMRWVPMRSTCYLRKVKTPCIFRAVERRLPKYIDVG